MLDEKITKSDLFVFTVFSSKPFFKVRDRKPHLRKKVRKKSIHHRFFAPVPRTEEKVRVSAGLTAKAKHSCLTQKRKGKPMYNNEIEKDVALLPYQKTEYLRDLWQSYFDCPPPKFNKSTLVNRLAYRMQEMEYGGLPQDIKDRIYDAVHGKTPKRKQIVGQSLAQS